MDESLDKVQQKDKEKEFQFTYQDEPFINPPAV
jgi:hypothetical protein